MTEPLRLMCVLAHPDDESLGSGGILARYSAEAGMETYLLTATRGERGWRGPKEEHPDFEAVGRTREAETRASARVLGVREVSFLGYMDGDLAEADPAEAISKIVLELRRVRPQVVVTFSPDGHTGHPDHIAVCQLTSAALVCAADAGYDGARRLGPHRVQKFYYMVDGLDLVAAVREHLGDVGMTVDGVKRRHVGWDDWAISARIDVKAHWRTVRDAIFCHVSQSHTLGVLAKLSEEGFRDFWGNGTFYRVYSLVNGGRALERDLFEGLR